MKQTPLTTHYSACTAIFKARFLSDYKDFWARQEYFKENEWEWLWGRLGCIRARWSGCCCRRCGGGRAARGGTFLLTKAHFSWKRSRLRVLHSHHRQTWTVKTTWQTIWSAGKHTGAACYYSLQHSHYGGYKWRLLRICFWSCDKCLPGSVKSASSLLSVLVWGERRGKEWQRN